MKPIRALATFALLLSAAACDVLGSDDDRGTLLFRYSGDISGTYQAAGEYRGPGSDESYAAGTAFRGTYLRVEAWNGRGDLFVLNGGSAEPGTYGVGEGQFGGGLALTYERASGTASATYDLTAGTVVIEEVTEDRIRGRFSATGVRPGDPGRTITITDGYFDVPTTLDPPVMTRRSP